MTTFIPLFLFLELPTSPVTVYDQDNVIVTLRFDAEFSNVLVIRALIDTDDDDVILDPGRQPLQFQLPENKVGVACQTPPLLPCPSSRLRLSFVMQLQFIQIYR